VRHIEYAHILKPDVDYLRNSGTLFLNSKQMAEFLKIPRPVLTQLVYTDRTPLPVKLGLGTCFRWSVLELAEWVEAGCPRRGEWIKMHGFSGCYPMNAR